MHRRRICQGCQTRVFLAHALEYGVAIYKYILYGRHHVAFQELQGDSNSGYLFERNFEMNNLRSSVYCNPDVKAKRKNDMLRKSLVIRLNSFLETSDVQIMYQGTMGFQFHKVDRLTMCNRQNHRARPHLDYGPRLYIMKSMSRRSSNLTDERLRHDSSQAYQQDP